MKTKGFTLIELLVVVAVGLLLVGIVFASISVKDSIKVTTTEPVYPEATGHVVDTSDVISYEKEQALSKQLTDFAPTAEIAVVTVKTTEPLTIEEYSIKLAEKWKVGDKETDNGIIFLIATEDRQVRIEVGQGMEGTLNDSKTGQILDEAVVPYLKDNKWEEGILSGVNRIREEVQE